MGLSRILYLESSSLNDCFHDFPTSPLNARAPQTVDIEVLGRYFRNDFSRQGSNPIRCHRVQLIHPRSLNSANFIE